VRVGSDTLRALTLAFATTSWAALAAAEPPPCVVSGSAPARAFAGEQIVLRLRVLRRPDVSAATWISGPAFPGFRADALPGLSGEARERRGGAPYLVFEERYALFPVREGRIEIPGARLQCTLHALPGETPKAVVATLAPIFVEVEAPPAGGRPEGWSGLVGRVDVTSRGDPDRIRVGESLHVSVSIEGDADVRDVPAPFAGVRAVGGADLFSDRPALAADPGDRLRLRRTFSFDLVPRATGVFTFPAVRVPYFDPRTGRYGVAVSAPLEIRVDPANES
jgi:hypothetical protein